MTQSINMLDLQMRIADEMTAEGWQARPVDERLREARRRQLDAIRLAYQAHLRVATDRQDALAPDQRTTITGQLIMPWLDDPGPTT
jgi:uncharacterized damage-inducible protein DinB